MSRFIKPVKVFANNILMKTIIHLRLLYDAWMERRGTQYASGERASSNELSPSTCEEQHGSRLQVLRLQKDYAFRQEDGWITVFATSPELTQSEDDLISRTNFECSPGMPVPDSLKCSTQALHASTLRGKSGRETLDNDGIDTKPEKTVTRSLSQGTTAGPSHTVGQLHWALLQL